jgi:hypothetical protein
MHNYNKYSDEALFQMIINDILHAYTEIIYNRDSYLLHSHVFVKLQSLGIVVENYERSTFRNADRSDKTKGFNRRRYAFRS